MQMIDLSFLSALFQEFIQDASKFGSRLAITLLLILLAFGIRYLLLRLIGRRLHARHEMFGWRRNSFYIVAILLFLLMLPIWVSVSATLITVLSIIGTGTLIVLKEVILNIVGWFYLAIRRPFEIGNRIKIGEYTGDLIGFHFLDFSMIEVHGHIAGGQSTGRILHIPNSLVFVQPVANASKQFSFNWNEITIPLAEGSNWQKAVKILEEIAAEMLEGISDSDQRLQAAEEKYAIHYNVLSPSVYVDFHDYNITLHLRHLIEPRNARAVMDRLWRTILARFEAAEDIALQVKVD